MLRAAIFVCSLLVFAGDALADVRLPHVFGDHAVLQRDAPIPVWGWAEPGEKVTIRFGGRTTTAVARGGDGRWDVTLPARRAGGPHKLVVSGKRNTVRVKDVLIGEVWLCSGQSNMAWTVRQVTDARKEIAAATDPKIRCFTVPRKPAGSPLADVDATWAVCSPKTVAHFTACGYFLARELREALRVPVGLLHASWGGTRIEPWTAQVGFEQVPALSDIAAAVSEAAGTEPKSQQQATVLYNGMIHALIGYGMRGAVWYQGESNRSDGARYTEKMKALIVGWRGLWCLGDFPFFFVQIAPYGYGKESPGILPVFQEAQAAVLDVVPNTGMVVTNDIATVGNIHPPNKQDVGKRLALLALNRTYGKTCEDSGPVCCDMSVEGATLRLSFDHADGGLRTRDRKAPTCFEIAGPTSGFVPADAKIRGDTIVLSSKAVPDPVAMRFAWNKTAEPNLVNRAGLPAGPFRAGEIPQSDFLAQVAEAEGYTLVYDLDLERLSANPAYDVDDSTQAVLEFDRVAYLIELSPSGGTPTFLWVSMEAFTDDLQKIAVPTEASGARFQQTARDLVIVSNAEGVKTGTGLVGNLEFWSTNYGKRNVAKVKRALDKVYDCGDEPSGAAGGYGSMQVHVPRWRQTLFAVNHWSAGPGADLGIGNSTLATGHTDWTFAANAGAYVHKRLRVFVRPR